MIDNKSDTYIQNLYKEYVSKKRFTELAKLVYSSNKKTADYIIRMGYKSYIEESGGNRVKLFSIMKLKEITSVKPDMNVMRFTCELALEMDSPEVIESIIKRIEIDKSVFQEMSSALQKVYNKYVNDGRFVDISRLMELTNTMPADGIIHKGYEFYLSEGKFISFSGLKKRTGIPPDESMIHDFYREYFANYIKNKHISKEKAQLWHDWLKKLKRISKINPPDDINLEELEEKTAEVSEEQKE
jgi:hypothetical protein